MAIGTAPLIVRRFFRLKVIRWVCVLMFLVVVIGAISSSVMFIVVVFDRGSIAFADGGLRLAVTPSGNVVHWPLEYGWNFFESKKWRVSWSFEYANTSSGYVIFIPSWPVLLLTIILCGVCMRKEYVLQKRLVANHCCACGYDVSSLLDNNCCPECGNALGSG